MTTTPRAGPDAGFTLLEILVALVVFGFLMAGLSQGVRFGLAAWGTQARIIERRGDLDAVDRTLRQLVQRMDPGTRGHPPEISGTQARFAFTSVMPMAAGGETADMLLGTDAGNRLTLRWTPHVYGKRIAPPPPPRSEELLSGVERVDLAYYLLDAGGGRWVQNWTARELPALVRIRFVFADRRRWPDIVARPLRANPKH